MTREKGFTIMETLLAVTLFAVVMTSIYSVTSMGLHIWKRSRDYAAGERKTILALERMGQELRSAIPYPPEDDTFSIHKSAVQTVEYKGDNSFVMIPAVFNSRETAEDILGGNGRITYQWDRSARALCRRVENASDLYRKSQGRCVPVISGVEKVKFRYWITSGITKSHSWYDDWNGKEGLPEAVEITLVTKQKKNLASRTIQKVILIPAGGQRL